MATRYRNQKQTDCVDRVQDQRDTEDDGLGDAADARQETELSDSLFLIALGAQENSDDEAEGHTSATGSNEAVPETHSERRIGHGASGKGGGVGGDCGIEHGVAHRGNNETAMDTENPEELGHDNDDDNASRSLEGRLERSLHKAVDPVVDVGAGKGLEAKAEDSAHDEDNKDRDHNVEGLGDTRGNRRRHLDLDLVDLREPAEKRTEDNGRNHADKKTLSAHLSGKQTRHRSLESRAGTVDLDGGANHGNVGRHGNECGRILRSLLGASQVKANQEGNRHRHEGHGAVVDGGKCRLKPASAEAIAQAPSWWKRPTS